MLKLSLLFGLICVTLESFGQLMPDITTSREQPMGVVSFASSVTSSGFTNGSHIDGYVRKYGTNNFIFPVGHNGFFRPFAAAANATTGAYYMIDPATVTIGNGITGGPFVANKSENVGKISNIEFWDINGAAPTRLTLTWTEASNLSVLLSGRDLSKLLLLGYDGSRWVEIPALVDTESLLGGTSSMASGSITTRNSLVPDAYQVYSLGAAPESVLPVNLISFDAFKQENTVRLAWATSAEINHDQFVVERRNGANSWTAIGFIKSSGAEEGQKYSFVDESPVTGENLYRLKMEDRDGSFAYSTIRSVKLESGVEEILVYPNPVSDKLFVKSAVQSEISEVAVINKWGSAVVTRKYSPVEGADVKGISAGTYVVKVTLNNGSTSFHKVIIMN